LATEPPPLRVFLRYFLRLGALGFGGPIALAGYMQRDLVDRRRWIAPQDYVDGSTNATPTSVAPSTPARIQPR